MMSFMAFTLEFFIIIGVVNPRNMQSFFSPSSYDIGADGYYGIGALCNGVYSNSTTINFRDVWFRG